MPLDKPLLLARLATARADLLWSVLGLDETTLIGRPVIDVWTAKDILAHVAAWEHWTVGRVRAMLTGHAMDMVGVEAETENPRIYAERKDWPLCRVMVDLTNAHNSLLYEVDTADASALDLRFRAPWGNVRPAYSLRMSLEHDQEHTATITAWRASASLATHGTGPGCVLLPALVAARDELLAWAALLPEGQRAAELVCGTWTLKDVLGHVADWERFVVDALADMAAGKLAGAGYGDDEEAWNQTHAAARQDQPWQTIWDDFTTARHDLLAAVAGLDDTALCRAVGTVWSRDDSPYDLIHTCVSHDRQHAEGLRKHISGAS